jgi:hypothetical protein
MVRSNIPVELDVNHESILIIGATEFTIESENNEVLVALSRDGTLLGSAYSDETDIATIVFDEPISVPGELDLVVTAYNTIPYETTVNAIAPEGPYILLRAVSIDSGGNDRLAFGELSYLSADLENVGTENSDSITVVLHQDAGLVNFDVQTLNFEPLEPGADATIGPFEFQVSYNVDDQSTIEFTLEIISSESTWEYPFTLSVNAPDHVINSLSIFDGGNGAIDPGESATVQLIVENTGHAPLSYPTFTIATNDPYLTIQSTASDNDYWWDVSGQVMVTAAVTAVMDAPTGHTAILNLTIGSLNTDYEYFIPVPIALGFTMEDFETGNFEVFDWQHSGETSWFIQGSEVFSGSYAARSGAIENGQTTELSLNLTILYDGEIHFAAKASSEQDVSGVFYDYLAFYVDGQDMGDHIGGSTDWQEYTFFIPAGEHSFKWVYLKNQNQSTGDDCAWLDRIIFPAGSIPVLNIDFGDPNEDNNINVLDIIITVANVLGYTEFSTDQFLAADMNMDGNVDVFDIMLIVDAALYAE